MDYAIKDFDLVFWDFDGVIKDSVSVKTEAFAKLFETYGSKIQEKVISHHIANGGVSRRIKIDLYYRDYIGEPLSSDELESKCNEFSEIVLHKVINSEWVKGVEEYIRNNTHDQTFYLVTGTPQNEIDYILDQLDILHCFVRAWGSPHEKDKVISDIMGEYNSSKSAVMIGDSRTDFDAATSNNISFILRKTEENIFMHNVNGIHVINDFNDVDDVKGISR